jgi:hypothetical protein
MLLHSHPQSVSGAAAVLAWAIYATAAQAEDMGLPQLRLDAPNLLGQGVVVAQPEAGTNFEIDPTSSGVTVPITYIYLNSTRTRIITTPNYDSSLYSWHASYVAKLLAGSNGAAPSLDRLLNYNADFYVNYYVLQNNALSYSPKVINQSFIETPDSIFTVPVLEQFFDNFVATTRYNGSVGFNYTIVTAAGNGGNVQVPGTAYNVITVGAYGGASSSSVTGQRAKPDITAPESATSFSTPWVSGIAALMVQAAGTLDLQQFPRGRTDGVDPRAVKAILLNGATKPDGWTHSSEVPLDRVYGAGIVNADNSYHNLMAGEHTASSTTTTASLGGAHPAVTIGNVGAAGWNLASLTSSVNADAVDHYVIDLSQSNAIMTLTATLTWMRANYQSLTDEYNYNIRYNPTFTNFTSSNFTTINNLDLYLYNANTQSAVDQSKSSIDNVEHLYTINLTPGKYDLQVLKNGGNTGTANVFSSAETYGFTWNVSNISTVNNTGNLVFTQTNNVTISSPIIGTGTLTQSGMGTTTLTAYTGTGPVSVNSGRLQFASTNAERQTPAVLIQAQSLTMGSNAVLDITNHDLMIGDSNLTRVEAQILAGLGTLLNGNPSNPGDPVITSSTMFTEGDKFLVPLDADAILGTGVPGSAIGQIWDNVTITQTGTIIILYTYFGDADFNGRVDIGDYGPIQDNFNKDTPGLADIFASWQKGDLDLSGHVDVGDYAPIQDNFGKGVGNPLGTLIATGIAASPVPESESLLLLGIGGILLLKGRRLARRSAI